ncbi:MAG TPA: hypothetical protein VGP28_11320 [Methylocella sp.]|nr:hypothetical protein [Methylocella sp.]
MSTLIVFSSTALDSTSGTLILISHFPNYCTQRNTDIGRLPETAIDHNLVLYVLATS